MTKNIEHVVIGLTFTLMIGNYIAGFFPSDIAFSIGVLFGFVIIKVGKWLEGEKNGEEKRRNKRNK